MIQFLKLQEKKTQSSGFHSPLILTCCKTNKFGRSGTSIKSSVKFDSSDVVIVKTIQIIKLFTSRKSSLKLDFIEDIFKARWNDF